MFTWGDKTTAEGKDGTSDHSLVTADRRKKKRNKKERNNLAPISKFGSLLKVVGRGMKPLNWMKEEWIH